MTGSTTVRTRKTTAAKLRVLCRGAKFASLDELLEHLATVALRRPELLNEGRRA